MATLKSWLVFVFVIGLLISGKISDETKED